METIRLKYFCTIAETGSLTKAAEILAVSHSGLSKAISTLEAETKLKLFRPQGRGLEITPEGRWFYHKAQEILKIENEISTGLPVQNTSVRIGLSEVLAVTCSEFFAVEFTEPLALIQTDLGEVERSLIGNELDFGIVFSPAPKSDLDYLELGEVRLNAFAREDLLKHQDPAQISFAIPTSQFDFNPLGYKIRDGWPQDIPRASRCAVSSFSMVLNLLRSGLSASYMPNFVARLEKNVAKIPYYKKTETKRKMYLVKRKNAEESTAMKKAAKIVRRICID